MARLIVLLAALLSFSALPAAAQTAPVTVQFVGTITGSAADTLTINGQPWTGPLPDFPYVTGDQITVSFTAVPGQPAVSSDGIYRYTVVGPSQQATGAGYASISSMDVSGAIAPAGSFAGAGGILLVYNSNTGTYSMELSTNQYLLGSFDGPSYQYDPVTGAIALTSTTRPPVPGSCTDQAGGCFNVTGTMDSGSIRTPVYGTDGSQRGFWSMLFSGDWFVNGVMQPGGATQVPEPGQLGLFVLALVPLVLRRRRRRLG